MDCVKDGFLYSVSRGRIREFVGGLCGDIGSILLEGPLSSAGTHRWRPRESTGGHTPGFMWEGVRRRPIAWGKEGKSFV
jgi:hypothetical protein